MANRQNEVGERIRVIGERCVYCGERATCWDHFPPYAVDRVRGWLLPSCGECNGIAGDRHPYDFEARAAYVNRALISRWRHVLDSTPWSPAELRELGRGLADSIEPLAHARLIARERVRWSAVAYLATLGHGRRFQPIVSVRPVWRKPCVIESQWRHWLRGAKRWRAPCVRERWQMPVVIGPLLFPLTRQAFRYELARQRRTHRKLLESQAFFEMRFGYSSDKPTSDLPQNTNINDLAEVRRV